MNHRSHDHYSPVNAAEIHDTSIKRTAEVLQINKIFKQNSHLNFDPKRYRMHVRLRGHGISLKGLIDTGANVDVLSLAACRKLGIANRIKPGNFAASGVDGHSVGTIGVVRATIHVGDIPYTADFHVLKHVQNFHAMIGTKFLLDSNLMDKIFNVMKSGLGNDHVSKGN